MTKNKYYVSAGKYPYLDREQIRRYNSQVKETGQITKTAIECQAEDEKNRTVIGLVVGVGLCIIMWILILSYIGEDGYVIALMLSLPTLGICYGMLSNSLPVSPELKLLEATIEEKKKYLDNELLVFEEQKKKQARYWLSMSGYQFEKEIAKLYTAYNYNAQVTKGSGDGGIDIFLEKDGRRYGVQCKNHHRAIGPAAIRDLYGAMSHEGLDEGIFIASSGYTKGAKEFAHNKSMRLLDINDVLRMHAATIIK